MNVLLITGKFNIGGAEKVVLDLANGLRRRGHNVTLCIRERGALSPHLEGVNVSVIPRRAMTDLGALYRICRLIKDKKVDIVHAHLAGSIWYGFLAAKITGRKFIITIHGSSISREKKTLGLYTFVSCFADKVVTVSEYIKREFMRAAPIGEKRIRNIVNGIPNSDFQVTVDTLAKRREFGIDPHVPLLGCVGNVAPIKGYDQLIRSFVIVKRRYGHAKLLIVGGWSSEADERHKSTLKELAGKLDLAGDVIFAGTRQDVREILQIIDVFVLPSRNEGTSISLLEAMASGRAIVATNVGGTPFVFENDEGGVLVSPESPAELADGILRILGNPDFARQIGNRAKKIVEDKYGVDRMIENYRELYGEVLNHR